MKTYKKAGVFLDSSKEGQKVDEQIKDIHIKVADKHLPILSLSGGNQQKVVIGKGILTEPKILLMDEPSRGIDIGAKTEVFDIINQYAKRGTFHYCCFLGASGDRFHCGPCSGSFKRTENR